MTRRFNPSASFWEATRIALVGDYSSEVPAHRAIPGALERACAGDPKKEEFAARVLTWIQKIPSSERTLAIRLAEQRLSFSPLDEARVAGFAMLQTHANRLEIAEKLLRRKKSADDPTAHQLEDLGQRHP